MKIASEKSPIKVKMATMVSPEWLGSLKHQKKSLKSVSGAMKKSPSPGKCLQNFEDSLYWVATLTDLKISRRSLQHRENPSKAVPSTVEFSRRSLQRSENPSKEVSSTMKIPSKKSSEEVSNTTKIPPKMYLKEVSSS